MLVPIFVMNQQFITHLILMLEGHMIAGIHLDLGNDIISYKANPITRSIFANPMHTSCAPTASITPTTTSTTAETCPSTSGCTSI